MADQEKTIIAFDLYGTILSTSSVAEELSKRLSINDEKAGEVATLWRRYQLEYSWRLSCMNKFPTFSEVTLNSLHHALLDLSIPLPPTKSGVEAFNKTILDSYNALTPFPDALAGLKTLSSSSSSKSTNLVPFIFSNGTSPMLRASIHESEHLKDHASLFQEIISVEETRKFKPCPEVYFHLARKTLGLEKDAEVGAEERKRVWLVSGNPFDVVGAKAVGLRAAWVDRGGNGWADRLLGWDSEDGKPDLIVKGVDDAIKGIGSWARS